MDYPRMPRNTIKGYHFHDTGKPCQRFGGDSMRVIILTIVVLTLHRSASAAFTVYTNKQAWEAAAGATSSIYFTGYPQFTIITNQYAGMGITFPDGDDFIRLNDAFSSDGAGLVGASDSPLPQFGVHMSFDAPRNAMAFEYAGGYIQLQFLQNGQIVHSTSYYNSSFVPFLGFVTDSSFDTVVAWDQFDGIMSIDNLHFGGAVPAPGAIGLAMLAGLTPRRRRRRSC
jgi:hypothetical protein